MLCGSFVKSSTFCDGIGKATDHRKEKNGNTPRQLISGAVILIDDIKSHEKTEKTQQEVDNGDSSADPQHVRSQNGDLENNKEDNDK